MAVKWTTKKNKIPEIETSIKGMKGKKVIVGALKGEHAWLAGIHEYGVDITPSKSQYLTVPLNREAAENSARSFPDLFCIKSKKGNLLLVKKNGKEVIPYYWLTKSVKIPERAFLRNGHDENIDRVLNQTERMMSLVLSGKKSVDDMLDECGKQLSTAIKKYMGETKPNSSITKAVKGASTPLTGLTGGLVNSITWEIE